MSLIFDSCDDQYDIVTGYRPVTLVYYLNPSKTVFEDESCSAHTTSFTITALDDTEWKLSNDNTWFSLSPSSGEGSSTVTISLNENEIVGKKRVGEFYLQSAEKDWEYHRIFRVIQLSASPILSVDCDSLLFTKDASKQEVTVSSNGEWTASASSEWIELGTNYQTGKLSIMVGANRTNKIRHATVVISFLSLERKIYITQFSSTP